MAAPSRGLPGEIASRSLALLLRTGIGLLRLLSPVSASNLGGWVGRRLGPFLSASRIADRNLRLALPGLDAGARARIISRVWDNLGRNVTELPHLAVLIGNGAGGCWTIEGEQHLAAVLEGGQSLFFSGHFGNWELVLPIAASLGLQVSGFYRAASDARIDGIIQSLRQGKAGSRTAGGAPVSMFPKGAAGARAALSHLQHGGSLGMLVDQKMNDGIAVPFFGHPAMTAPALAQLALRYRIPVIPIRVIRRGPARFALVVEAPLPVTTTGRRHDDIFALSLAINQRLERWIRQDPGAWLWLHSRWPNRPRESVDFTHG